MDTFLVDWIFLPDEFQNPEDPLIWSILEHKNFIDAFSDRDTPFKPSKLA